MSESTGCPFCNSTHFMVDLSINDDYELTDGSAVFKWGLTLSCAQCRKRVFHVIKDQGGEISATGEWNWMPW